MGEVLADAAAEREHLVGARLHVGRARVVDELAAHGRHQRPRALAPPLPLAGVLGGELRDARRRRARSSVGLEVVVELERRRRLGARPRTTPAS